MKKTALILIPILLFSCFGSDEGVVKIGVRIPLSRQLQTEIGSDTESSELSIDSYFAVAKVLVRGEKTESQELSLFIRYADAKLGNYWFDTVVEAVVGDRLSISFGGYYKIDQTSVGGFVSDGEYQLDVREGVVSDVAIESKDVPVCEVTLNIQDKSVKSVIFLDPLKGLYLMTIGRTAETGMFYLRLPEGKYDIYSTDENNSRKLLKPSQEIKGSSVKIDL